MIFLLEPSSFKWNNKYYPSLTGVVNEDTINIDASEYFQTMTLFKGDLIINL